MRRHSTRRLLFRTLLALMILAATLCGRFLYGIYADNAAMQGVFLPPSPVPPSGATVLVVAPHCDDETLGVGGLIGDAVRRGARVSVAFVTNGDGFPMAVSREYRRLRPGPEDYQRMARQRQGEARAALARLGVPRERIFFLGYPDRGIAELWNQYWRPDNPYQSRFTGCSVSPYGNSFHQGAVYCGQDLMLDLQSLLRRLRPQWLYIPHPSDDHPDHWATHCFAMAALEELRDESLGLPLAPSLSSDPGARLGPDWSAIRVFTYLVHRGDWPVPQGMRRDARLVPPAPMANLDTQWSALTLTAQAEADKEAALLCYRSQTAVMRRFLTSFVRRDELIGALPPVELTRERQASMHWRTAITDPAGDTLLRRLEGSADLTSVEATVAADRLRLRITTRLSLSPRATYTLRLHPLGRGAGCAEPLNLSFHRFRCDDEAIVGKGEGNELETSIPLARLGHPAALLIGADSHLGRVPIDRAGWRVLRLPASGSD